MALTHQPKAEVLPPRNAIALDTLAGVRGEMGRLYRLGLNGRIRSDEMTRFVYALKEIRACLEAEMLTDIQQRLALLSRDMLVTQIATAVAAFSWMLVEWGLKGKPTVVGICSGAVAGLVAVTPASGFVGPVGAFAIGIAAGVVCYWGCTGLKRIFSYDDALDCFGIHAVGGIVGALLTGVFAVEQYGGTAGVLEGNVGQFFNQCIGVAIVFVYDAVASLIILSVVKMFVGLRVTENIEREGLDLALHGEVVQ